MSSPTFSPAFPCLPQLSFGFYAQESIGWSSFLEGRLSHLWAAVQQAWYQYLKKRNTGLRWVSQLILKLLNIAWDQWEHRNGIRNQDFHNARHQFTSRLVADKVALGPRGLSGNSLRLFNLGPRLLCQPSHKQEAWLANVQAARRRLEAKHALAEASLRSERSLMRRWLHG